LRQISGSVACADGCSPGTERQRAEVASRRDHILRWGEIREADLAEPIAKAKKRAADPRWRFARLPRVEHSSGSRSLARKMRSPRAAPLLGGQAIESCVISLIRVGFVLGPVKEIVDMLRQRQPYCVDRLVSVIFDDRVEYGVRLYVRQPDAGSPAISLAPAGCARSRPATATLRLGRLEGIVASHVEPFGRWSRKGNWIARDRTQATERREAARAR
jgi:hypothetical protein